MAITRDQLQAAVEQYLPRTVNFAADEVTGQKDRDAIFEKVMQVLLTSILLDEDAVFYIIYLTSQRLKASLESAITSLESLRGSEQLRAVQEDQPTRIEDLTKLQDAMPAWPSWGAPSRTPGRSARCTSRSSRKTSTAS